jgi:hypothetical protein
LEEYSASIFSCRLLPADFLLGLFFVPEDGGSTFLRNITELLMTTRRNMPNDNDLHSRRCKNLKDMVSDVYWFKTHGTGHQP